MKKARNLLTGLVALVSLSPRLLAAALDITTFGAVRSDTEPSTKAINAAIDECASKGGGRVVIPAGRFTSGTIVLRSNVELHLEAGATLLASTNRDDFTDPQAPAPPLVKGPGWGALILAERADNISITGAGGIDGRGQSKINADQRDRVKNIMFVSCRNVSVTGVSINNANHWNQQFLDCEDVIVDRIRVFNHAHGNNDGIDIDGSRRVVISNSIIDSDDDGIVLKSTGLAACEDVVISNCVVSSHANAIKCGTESLGGFRNIAISNCVVKPSRSPSKKIGGSAPHGLTGISLIIVDGGVMEGVSIQNVVIRGTESPLYVRLANRGRKVSEDAPAPAIGSIRNVRIDNVTAYGTGNYGASITGVPGGKISDISLSNIRFINQGGLTAEDAYDPATLKPSDLRHDMGGGPPVGKFISSFQQVIEDENGYPQPTVWRSLPSYGLFLRHAGKVRVKGMELGSDGSEPRIPVIAVDVDSLHLRDVDLPAGGSPVDVLLKDVRESRIDPDLAVKTED